MFRDQKKKRIVNNEKKEINKIISIKPNILANLNFPGKT